MTVVEELKRRRSVLLHGTSIPIHGFESSTHSIHSHRRRRALPNLSRSSTPIPHSFLDLHTITQFTKQCPPLAFSSPFHKKDLSILSIFFLAQATSGNTVRWYVSIKDRTVVTKVSLPALFSILPFQLGSLWPMRSMRGCTLTFCKDLVCSYSPR